MNHKHFGKHFLLEKLVFNRDELEDIHRTIKQLGLDYELVNSSQFFIIGLDPNNREDVEAFFTLAQVDIGQPEMMDCSLTLIA